ncbi:ABC-type transport auxiliary lipoprotein family protein [Pistricoccus aurantiacus]|uniref:ABC-type transport auxiliary lipoprotein family protein n=1 Tax=Pistricoccus aurantiacus TaxID=1883414 RepID=UPI00363D2B1F
MKSGFGFDRRRGISRIFLLAIASLVTTLPACTLLSGSTPSETFVLPTQPIDTSSTAPLETILRVATPEANETLKGRRILVMPTANRLKAYQGARWSDAAPGLLRDRLIAAFRQDGRLAGVVGDNSPVKSDVILLSELSAFHSEYRQGKPWAVIRLDAQLIDGARHRLLANRRFSVGIESQDEQLESVVEAFGEAADQLSHQLIDWSLDNIDDYLAN